MTEKYPVRPFAVGFVLLSASWACSMRSEGLGAAPAAPAAPAEAERDGGHKGAAAEGGAGGETGVGGEAGAGAGGTVRLPAMGGSSDTTSADAGPEDAPPLPIDASIAQLPDADLVDATPLPPELPPLDPSLVAWWKFDEPTGATIAKDSSGHGHDGTLTMLDPARVWVRGRIGGALQIQSEGHFTKAGVVIVPSTPGLGLSSTFTFAAWIKRGVLRTPDPRAMIARQAAGRGDLFWVGLDADQLTVSGTRLGAFWALPETLYTTEVWGHVAVTCNGDKAVVYVDGKPVQMRNRLRQDASIAGGNNDDAPIVIGGRMMGSMHALVEPLEGAIDDLRVYDRALGADEIRALAAP